jgi:hypothetical protein
VPTACSSIEHVSKIQIGIFDELNMPPSRLFSFEQSLEQLKLPWSSENTFSVLAKGCTVDEGLAKIREKWTSIPLLCQRQIMIMLANELEADTSLIRPMEELASQIDMSEHADDWLRYFVSSSNGTTFMAQVNVLHQPLFPECISLPDRTSLPEELAYNPAGRSGEPLVQVVNPAALAPKTSQVVAKPSRPPVTAPSVPAVSVTTHVEVSKHKNIAELVDSDPDEPEVKKGPQKKKRCR